MKVIIEGTLLSIPKKPDFTDKESGEVTIGKNFLQLLVDSELSNGEKVQDIQNVSIPKTMLSKYESQIGKKVEVECSYISKSPVSFYVS
ncbi:hypothetical protein [Sulfurimonas sp.]|uniref:hypothetical protein n=1 Tax=Sulfurimonas sp. TaxID=2022749 RepID=UPI003D09E0C2